MLIHARGTASDIQQLLDRLRAEPPPLADITAIEVKPFSRAVAEGFVIVESASGEVHFRLR